MKIAPVDYMPVMHTPPGNDRKKQTNSPYLDGQEPKGVKEDADCAVCSSITQFQLPCLSHTDEYIPSNPDNFIKAPVAEIYRDHLGWGNNTFIGWTVDTVT